MSDLQVKAYPNCGWTSVACLASHSLRSDRLGDLGDDLIAFFFGLAQGWEIKTVMVIILAYQPVIEDP